MDDDDDDSYYQLLGVVVDAAKRRPYHCCYRCRCRHRRRPPHRVGVARWPAKRHPVDRDAAVSGVPGGRASSFEL